MHGKSLYRCMTKATKNEKGHPRYSSNWIVARRALFTVFEDCVKCGDWIIAVSDIQEAIIYKTRQMFIPVNILELTTTNETFQFGFNPWANPFRFLKINYKVEYVKLKMSLFSLILRIVLIAGVVATFMIKYL